SEAVATDTVRVSWKMISDLTGIEAFSNLKILECAANSITTLDNLSHSLVVLDCSGNTLMSLNLSGMSNLQFLSCGGNWQLDSLDLSGCTAGYLNFHCEGNNLSYLNVKNGSLNYTPYNLGNVIFDFGPCLNLHYICSDPGDVLFLLEYFIMQGNDSIQIDTTCTFSTSSGYGTITTSGKLDYDRNGCSASDPDKTNFQLKLINDADTAQTFMVATGYSSLTEYTFYTYPGNYSIIPSITHPYFILSADTLHFTTLARSAQNLQFCVVPNGIHPNLHFPIDTS